MPALRGMWALKEIIFWKLLAQPWLIVLTKQMETALIISVISADVASSWTIIASNSSAHRCDSWNELRDSRRDSNTPQMGNRHQMYLVKAALTWLHSFLFIPCLQSHVYASSLSSPVYHPFHQGFISVGLLSNLTYSLTRPTGIAVVQSFSRVWLFVTPWTAACQSSMQGQALLSFTISQRLLKFTSIESVMPSNHLILCQPLCLLPSLFPSIRVFSNESTLHIGGQSVGASASASVLPMNIQGWFPLGLTDLISLQTSLDTLDALLRGHAWLWTSVVPTTASS